MNDVLTEVRFWQQVATDAQRTVLVNPDLESRVKGWVAAAGLGGLLTVKASRPVPIDQVFVIDEHAMAAQAAKPIRDLGLFPPGHPLRSDRR